MRRKIVRIVSVSIVLLMLFACTVYADCTRPFGNRVSIPKLTMTVTGSTATCKVVLRAPGQSIDATLELKQGNTVIASWSGTGTGVLILSGTATVTSGVTYTLTVSGTIGGVAFTPESITKTP